MKKFFTLLLCAFIASCASLPTITPSAKDYRVERTVIVFEEGAKASWPSASMAYAQSQGVPGPRQYDPTSGADLTKDPYFELTESEEGIAYVKNTFSERASQRLQAVVAGTLKGSLPARLEIRANGLHVVGPGERVFVNIPNQIIGTVSLIDEASNTIIASRPLNVVVANSVGGLASLAIDIAQMGQDKQFEKLSNALNNDIEAWLKTAY